MYVHLSYYRAGTFKRGQRGVLSLWMHWKEHPKHLKYFHMIFGHGRIVLTFFLDIPDYTESSIVTSTLFNYIDNKAFVSVPLKWWGRTMVWRIIYSLLPVPVHCPDSRIFYVYFFVDFYPAGILRGFSRPRYFLHLIRIISLPRIFLEASFNPSTRFHTYKRC